LRVLTLIDCYLPGFKHGGPIRTLANLVESAPPDIEFLVLTRDRDRGDAAPYPGIPRDAWVEVGRAKVRYLPRSCERLLPLIKRVRDACPDVIYSNSLFSRMNVRVLLLRKLGQLPRTPFVLGPRGELSPGALKLKAAKKSAFLWIAGKLGLLRNLCWQASTDLERSEILAACARHGISVSPADVVVACDIAGRSQPIVESRSPKRRGVANFVFVSHISPKKQLDRVIDLMASLRGEIHLDIYGPIDDKAYWKLCEERLAALPASVLARYHGPVEQSAVAGIFAKHDAFVFPTLGENFGHVIAEALRAAASLF